MKFSEKEIWIILMINISGVFAGALLPRCYIVALGLNLSVLLFGVNYLKKQREDAFINLTNEVKDLRGYHRLAIKYFYWVIGYIHNYCIFKEEDAEDKLIKHIERMIEEMKNGKSD